MTGTEHVLVSCSIGSHTWEKAQTEEGARYEVCRNCGKRASWVPLWAAD